MGEIELVSKDNYLLITATALLSSYLIIYNELKTKKDEIIAQRRGVICYTLKSKIPNNFLVEMYFFLSYVGEEDKLLIEIEIPKFFKSKVEIQKLVCQSENEEEIYKFLSFVACLVDEQMSLFQINGLSPNLKKGGEE